MRAVDKIFREYDIRGVVGVDFDSAFARRLGEVYAELVLEEVLRSNSSIPPVVAVGC